MKDCKDMFEGYREAIHVERMLKWSRMRNPKPQVGKSQQTTKAHIVETVVEEIKIDVERLIQGSSHLNLIFRAIGHKYSRIDDRDDCPAAI